MREVFIVLNPAAARNDDSVQQSLEAHFRSENWGVDVYRTTGQERIADVVRDVLQQRDAADLIVAAGGDGTVSGVAGGLVHANVPLGVVPLGTANTLARELGIPLTTDKAADLLTDKHRVRELDAMEVNGQYFILNVSVGLSGLMMRDTARMDKRRFGRVAYVWTGLKKLLGYQPHRFLVTIDGEERLMWASEVMIANSGALGDPALRWSPEVELDDGRIDVCIVRTRSALDYARFAGAVLLGRQREERAIRHFIADRSVVIDAPSGLPVQGDGEFIGRPPVEVKVVPSAVCVITPAKTERQSIADGLPSLGG